MMKETKVRYEVEYENCKGQNGIEVKKVFYINMKMLKNMLNFFNKEL